MAKAVKHQAVLPDGSIAKRSSQSKVYSHMACGQNSYEKAVAVAKESDDKSSFKYARNCAAGEVGSIYPGQNYKIDESMKAKGIAELAKYGSDYESYQAARIAEKLARIEAQKAEGYFDKWIDLGWSSRLDLAQKNAASHSSNPWWVNVRVVEAQIVG